MDRYQIINNDCRDAMRELEADSIDSIVSDPPYGLSFMNKGWDHGVPGEEFWREALRVAKPGAHLLAFGGTRTYHRLAVAIEDAGWKIRDCVMWVYGSGFPKSMDVSKAIDKAAGAEREVVGIRDDKGRVATFGGGPTTSAGLSRRLMALCLTRSAAVVRPARPQFSKASGSLVLSVRRNMRRSHVRE